MSKLWIGQIAPGIFSSGLVVGDPSAADIIDFTAAVLDSRVSYTGPVHLYWAADGTLQQSTANVWPQEYSGGAVIGRHLPERASQNLLPDTAFATGIWTKASGSTWTTESTDIGTTGIIGTAANINTAVYNSTTSAFVAAEADGGSPTKWTDVIRKFTTAAGALRWYCARQSSGMYLYGSIATAVAAGDFVATVMRKVDTSGLHSTLPQVEAGSNRTSPIINSSSSETNSRAASSVTITDTEASSCVLSFSDGSSVTLTPSDGVFTLPVETLDWGNRYLIRAILK